MKVKFLPQNVEFEIAPDQSVMKLAHEKGLKIKSVCNGMPSCAECRVKIVEGEHNVLPPSIKELSLIGTGYFIDRRRLSCQLLCFGDITVDLTEQLDKQVNDLQRRPQGNLRKEDTEESFAVSGNLLDQEVKLLESVEIPTKQVNPSSQRRHENQNQNQNRNQNLNQNQNNNSRDKKNFRRFRTRPNQKG